MTRAGRVVLETERLRLREFTIHDVDLLYQLDLDREVQRFVDSGQAPTRETLEHEVLPRLIVQYGLTPGHGFFPAFEKAGGAYIGWFHFRVSREDPADIDLGYQLLKRAWGHGYATEGSAALIARGFTAQNVQRVVGCALVANAASVRVMQKLGMTFLHEFEEARAIYPDRRAVKYALTRQAWEARTP